MSVLRTRLILLLLLAAVVAMLADLATAPRSKFTAANYERLRIDMTLDEAIAILGEPDATDLSMRDMRFVTWYSPFDAESAIVCLFVTPNEQLKSIDMEGRLPDRPLLIPDVLPRRDTPSYIAMLKKGIQEQERRATLMLDPPASASDTPLFP